MTDAGLVLMAGDSRTADEPDRGGRPLLINVSVRSVSRVGPAAPT